MDHFPYVVVGAGVTGLAFADWLNSEEVLILEANDEIGGYCRTVERDGFTWDYSGHFFHFKRPGIEAYLLERMADQRILRVEKDSRILWEDGFIDFPFQKNIHQLPKDDFIDCLVGLYFREDRDIDSFADMLYAKLGEGIADRFLIPYNEKLYATDLSRLDRDAMGRFFPHVEIADVIANFRKSDNASYNATFTYPEGGAIQYVHALAKGVPAERIALGEAALSINLRDKRIATSSREISFDTLVSTAPLPRLLSACGRPVDADTYTWNKVLVFNLGFDSKGYSGVHWIYVPQRDFCFYRVGFYDNIFGADRMSLYVEIGFPAHADLGQKEIDACRAQVLVDLRRAGILTDQRLVASHEVVLDPAYVHITKASMAAVEHEKRLLATRGVYSLGRYGSWTYCSIEDNIVEARELADVFNELASQTNS